MAEMNKVSLVFYSRLENVRFAALCSKQMAKQAFNDEAIAEIELAIVEVVNNSIIHAYASSTEYKITVEIELNEECLIIQTYDTGIAMNPDSLEKDHADIQFEVSVDSSIEELPEGGLGLKMIQHCMDEVSYQNLNNTNHWRLTKFRSKD